MNGFASRVSDADKMISVLRENFFDLPLVKQRFLLVPFGYETHINAEIRNILRNVRNETSQYIRFAPDFCLIDRAQPSQVYLLEFKCSRSPLPANKLEERRLASGIADLTIDRVGQMELAAYDNYFEKLHKNNNVRVAIMYYCSFSKQKLYCDYVERIKEIYRRKSVVMYGAGSGTPFINFDIESMRSFSIFFKEEHKIDVGNSLNRLLGNLGNVLPVVKRV